MARSLKDFNALPLLHVPLPESAPDTVVVLSRTTKP
jgi:hypothetical protein